MDTFPSGTSEHWAALFFRALDYITEYLAIKEDQIIIVVLV